ncbi:MAG: tetratricopeptide repeat protein [Steroidobacteraceae bacterium]
MLLFVTFAATLTLAAILLVTVPLLRGKTTAPWVALASVVVLLPGSVALYANWSNWTWPTERAAQSPAEMVARLARRLEREPDDLAGWLQLGRSYVVMGQPALALRAYGRADRLADGKNAEALIGMAEILTVQDDSALTGTAGELFERALAIDPKAGKALFFGAVSAMRRGELPVARERFATLLALDPPAEVRPLIEQQVAALDRAIAAGPATSDAAVRVTVRLAPDLAATAGDAPLFVFVRDPATQGPPLAAKRVPAKFPLEIELTAADAMMPSRVITAGKRVLVVARISRTGRPEAASGDPFGEVSYDVGRDAMREIVIDRLTP